MKSTSYIDWQNLVKIPFSLCKIREDKENSEIDFFYFGKLVFHDYNDVADYCQIAIELFKTIKRKDSEWVNLGNLWILRNCIRENFNHGLELEELIYGKDYFHTKEIQPMTKKRLFLIRETIIKKDEFATV